MQDSNSFKDFYPGQSAELLKNLHILTRDGKLNQDSKRKLKQVLHLVNFIEPLIKKAFEQSDNPTLVDCGAGKSYLGFILYDLVMSKYEKGQIVSIESRKDLFDKVQALALSEKFDRMSFVHSDVNSAPIQKADIVCALHACDTATDEAIALGLKTGARFFALVPCCQAEVAAQLQKVRRVSLPVEDQDLYALWDAPLHRREFGSHLTDVLRALYLQSKGYRVTVGEFTGFEHTQKNTLILAEKISDGYEPAKFAYDRICSRFSIKLSLIKT